MMMCTVKVCSLNYVFFEIKTATPKDISLHFGQFKKGVYEFIWSVILQMFIVEIIVIYFSNVLPQACCSYLKEISF